ncbi:MAG: hypothetical protein OYH77_06905 [Pseudomonadota bacterium]|nr:hypothetical protein [Pseudomonadota bacterium]
MRYSVMFLAMFCLALGTARASDHETDDKEMATDAMIAELVKAHNHTLTKLSKARKRVHKKLHALGARVKTAATWRKKWMKEGKSERISRYLDGKADNAKLWYLAASKANLKKMKKLGMGHIRVEYIEHWEKFNELTDTYNHLTACIVKVKLKLMKQDIAAMRVRIQALNDSYAKQAACVRHMKLKLQSMQTTVGDMLRTVKTQNLGLEMVLAYLRGFERGLSAD